jgi:hypothetical protein
MMSKEIQEIDLSNVTLDRLTDLARMESGRYILYIDRKVLKPLKDLFNYDSFREPPHPHYLQYLEDNGVVFYPFKYLIHYLFCGNEKYNATISEVHDRHELVMHLEIKRSNK